jgi:glutathione S-transferase
MSVHNLYYYAIPGKAEQIRLAFHVAGIEFKNNIVSGESYGKLKEELIEKVPQINIPLLEVDGKYLTESLAILRYVGTVGNLMPSNPFAQGKVDEGLNLSNDVFSAFGPTFAIADLAEKIAARQALCAPDGKISKIMQKMDIIIAGFSNGHMAGDMLTIGDICWFALFGLMSCGMIDGFASDYLNQYVNITKFRQFIGTNPKVASRYAKETEGLLFNGFKFE